MYIRVYLSSVYKRHLGRGTNLTQLYSLWTANETFLSIWIKVKRHMKYKSKSKIYSYYFFVSLVDWLNIFYWLKFYFSLSFYFFRIYLLFFLVTSKRKYTFTYINSHYRLFLSFLFIQLQLEQFCLSNITFIFSLKKSIMFILNL